MDIKPNTILNADILDIIPQIPDGVFSAAILDVPYEQEAHGRGFARKRSIWAEMSEWTILKNDWYSEDLMREYCRICKFPNLFCFGSKRDVWSLLKFAESEKLFYDILPVCKKAPAPFTNNNWLSNEYAIHITDRKLGYTKEYNLKMPYFIVGGQKTTGHPNEKDLPMVKRIVANITKEGDFVFDGFMGSGTTAVACQQLKRNFFGCELNKEYYEKTLKRLDDEKRQLNLF